MDDSMLLRVVQLKEQLTSLFGQADDMSDVERKLRVAMLQVEVNDLQLANLKEGLQILKKAEEYIDSENDEGIALCHKMAVNNQEAGRCLEALQAHLDYFRETGSVLPDAGELN